MCVIFGHMQYNNILEREREREMDNRSLQILNNVTRTGHSKYLIMLHTQTLTHVLVPHKALDLIIVKLNSSSTTTNTTYITLCTSCSKFLGHKHVLYLSWTIAN